MSCTDPECTQTKDELRHQVRMMAQEIVRIQDATNDPLVPGENGVDLGYVMRGNQRMGSFTMDLRVLQQSVALFGRNGSGKTTGAQVITKQLTDVGVGVVVFDHSGEWRPMYDPSEIVDGTKLTINPFDDMDGAWSDDQIHGFIRDSFFSFLGANSRGATNLGALNLIIASYLQETRPGDRDLASFADYLTCFNRTEHPIPTGTKNNLVAYVTNFLHDPVLASVFTHPRTGDALRRVILSDGRACIGMHGLPKRAAGIVTTYVLRMTMERLQAEFHAKGSSVPRLLTKLFVLEETRDIVAGHQAKEFVQEFHRVARKFGAAMISMPRNEEDLKASGLNNVLAEAGCLIFFAGNEYLLIKNQKLVKILKDRVTELPPGRAIVHIKGDVHEVQFHDSIIAKPPHV